MLWSYVGLWAATTSELIVRVPGVFRDRIGFGVAVGVATTVTVVVGGVLVQRTVGALRRTVRPADRAGQA